MDVWNRTGNDFVANVTSGNVTFPVQFNDTSFNATSWFWIFDGINTSTAQNPVFNYSVPGIYSVNHSSSNAHDTFWTNKSNYIIASSPGVIGPVAGFTGIPASGTPPLTVQFTDQSTGSPTSGTGRLVTEIIVISRVPHTRMHLLGRSRSASVQPMLPGVTCRPGAITSRLSVVSFLRRPSSSALRLPGPPPLPSSLPISPPDRRRAGTGHLVTEVTAPPGIHPIPIRSTEPTRSH